MGRRAVQGQLGGDTHSQWREGPVLFGQQADGSPTRTENMEGVSGINKESDRGNKVWQESATKSQTDKGFENGCTVVQTQRTAGGEVMEHKEHSILFTGPMVHAILDGQKTQTRRIIKPQPIHRQNCEDYVAGWVWRFRGVEYEIGQDSDFWQAEAPKLCPYGVPGDRLRMLSTWAVHQKYDHLRPLQLNKRVRVWTPWQDVPKPDQFGKMRPGRFCPLWMRKRWMPLAEITDVRVERVQDISEEDAVAEGVKFGTYSPNECRVCAKGAFMDLWNTLNAKRGFGWDVNPWVRALTFKVVAEKRT